MLNEIQLVSSLPDEYVDSLVRRQLDDRHYRTLISGEDIDVFKPDGTRLLSLRHKILPTEVCRLAYPALFRAAKLSDNRGDAAGRRYRRRRKDGTLSNQWVSPKVRSGIVGFREKTVRDPICRLTSFSAHDVQGHRDIVPFAQAADKVFQQASPERYAAQLAVAKKTPRQFLIPRTVFTTITVNRNWATKVHKDEGDLPEGFGVMSVISAGEYSGGYLVFPKYEIAVDMRSRDVLLADVHEWHGNTPIAGVEGEYERISTVLYYRSKMMQCPPR